MKKTFFQALFIVIFSLILIIAIVSRTEPTPKKANLQPTSTPELLIAPKTPTRTPTPASLREVLHQTIAANQSIQPTATPTQQIRAGIPIYSGSGDFLGYMDDYTGFPTVTATARKCTIKGNVSYRNENEKIYHCPNWRDYDRTDVNYSEGDRWFCTEAEAIAAGFRKPNNVTSPCIP